MSGAEASPLQWSATPLDNLQASSFTAASCPSASFCVAFDRTGNVYTSHDPEGGVKAWRIERLLPDHTFAYDVDCPSASLCLAVSDEGRLFTSTQPDGGPWTETRLGTDRLANVECPTTTLCVVATRFQDGIYTSTDPGGGAAAWTVRAVPAMSQVVDLSCPTTTLCVGVGQHNDILSSTNPTGPASAWTVTHVEGLGRPDAVSCASATLCTIASEFGFLATATDPAGPADAWTVIDLGDGNPHRVFCAANDLCLATQSANGLLYTSTDPTSGVPAWTRERVTPFRMLDCAGTTFCLGADDLGIVTTRAAAGGAAQWRRTSFAGIGAHAVLGLACPSPTRCLGVDDDGRVITSATPADPTKPWTAEADLAALGADTPTAIACATHCMAGDASGGLFARDLEGQWRRSAPETGAAVRGVACPTDTACVAVDDAGHARRFDGARWQTEPVTDRPLTGVACPAPTFCVAVDEAGRAHLWDGSSWTSKRVTFDGAALLSVACPTTGLCVASDVRGSIHITLAPGSDLGWRERRLYGHAVTALACPSASLCVAGDASGTIHTSTDPGSWSEWEWRDAFQAVSAVACAGDAVCVITDKHGWAFVGTGTGAPFNTAAPAITAATVRAGDTLRCDPGAWAGNPTLSYQWEWSGYPIPDATAPTYTTGARDEGQSLDCRVTAKNGWETAVARSATARVSTPPLATSELRLIGVAEAGNSLRCEAAFTGAPPLNTSYEWTRDGLKVPNWPYSHMLFGLAEAGHTYTCSVIGTNNAGRLALTSPPIIVAPPRTIHLPDMTPFTASITPQPIRLKTLLRDGVSVRATCSLSCTLTVKLKPDATTARRLGLRRTTVIGHGTFALAGGHTTMVPVKLSHAARQAIKRAKPRAIRFTVSATEPGKHTVTGESTVTARR